jgi:hypothetical protein
MKPFSTIYLIIAITFLIPKQVLSQTTIFSDNFDSYTVGEQLACQNPSDWTTWTGSPCSTIEDPLISNTYSESGPNSIVIKPNNDLLRLYGQLSNGICEVGFQIYIPAGKTGYFNSLNRFVLGDPNSEQRWAFECYLKSKGKAILTAGGSDINFTYTYNNWHPVQLIVDLDLDSAQLWFDGNKIQQWQWTKGYNGDGGYPLQLDATDFFGPNSTDEMYIDDFLVTYYPKITSTSTGGDWNTPSTWNENLVPSSGNPVEIVNGAIITLNSNIVRDTRTITNGILKCQNFNITGIGNFTLSAGATLEIGSASGITTAGNSGNIQTSGVRNYNSAANYVYNGTTAQSTGNGLPTTINDLTINNTAGVTLSNSNTISGALNLLKGNLSLNGTTLTLGISTANTGTLNRTEGFIVGSGTFKRWFSTTDITIGNSKGLFPMGTASDNRNVWVAGIPSTGGTVSVQHTDATGISALSFTENSQTFNKRTNMSWTLSDGDGFAGTNLSLRIQCSGLTGINSLNDLNISLSSGVTGGNYSIPTGSIVNPQVNRTNLTQATLSNTFYFASTSASPLPVELISFSGSVNNTFVKLNWETATEVNNYGFEIQRQSVDENNWTKIGFVNGSGNSNSSKNYVFEDKKVNTGKYLYRLKQIDNDGQFEYSNEIEVNLGIPNTLTLSQNYPNPFNPATVIRYQLSNPTFVCLKVYDTLGNEVVTLVNEQKNAGDYEIKFDGSKLASGMYIYQLSAGENVITKKMILMK